MPARLSLAPLGFAALLASSACIDIVGADFNKYVEREEKSFSVTGKPEVALFTFDGSIEIRPWDKPEVHVVVEKRGVDKAATDGIEVQATQQGNRVTVEVKEPRGKVNIHFGPGRSAKLIVSLPASADVQARSGDGSIDVERVAGRVELRSGDGSIRARELSGDVNVQTGDGSIVVDGKFASLRARSGDGSVKVHAIAGSSPSSDWEIVTGDGSVTLEIPDGFNSELDAHTGDGGIHTNDVTVSNVTGNLGRHNLRGRLGSGGPLVRVRTGDGSITLRRS